MNTEQERALLPCPFCGHKTIFVAPDEIGSGGQWVSPIHVGCNKCKAEQIGDDEPTARANWNRRAALQSQDREDAERYRWLRKHWFTMTSCYDGGRVEFTTGQPRYSSATEANVDEAIDHARRIEGDGDD